MRLMKTRQLFSISYFAMEEEAGNASEAPAVAGTEAAPLLRPVSVRRLRYDGEEGNRRKLRILNSCMQFKSTLFGTGKRSETYTMIAADMNKYHPELFFGILKDTGVQGVWTSSLKDADAQKKSMDEERHKWFNGNIMRELSELETVLSEMYAEKSKVDQKKEADKASEAAEEEDARKRKFAAIDRVGERYDGGKIVHPHSKNDDQTEDENDVQQEEQTTPSGSQKSGSVGSYGRGTRKGNDKRAGCNSGLSPDPKPDKLTEVCSKQGDVADQIAKLAAAIGNDVEQEVGGKQDGKQQQQSAQNEPAVMGARAQTIQATAVLMEQYLKFMQGGIPIPPMMQKLMDDA